MPSVVEHLADVVRVDAVDANEMARAAVLGGRPGR